MQNHKIVIKCKEYVRLSTKSKDWTKNFILETFNNQSGIKKIIKEKKLKNLKMGDQIEVFTMVKNFLKKVIIQT